MGSPTTIVSNPGDAANSKVTVFFDGSCPLCRKEISHYQRLDRGQRIDWCDISQKTAPLELHGISLEQAMRKLHVLDVDGRVKTRADAFVIMWQQLPYYQKLSQITDRLKLLPVMNFVYDIFARWRFRQWQARQCERSTG